MQSTELRKQKAQARQRHLSNPCHESQNSRRKADFYPRQAPAGPWCDGAIKQALRVRRNAPQTVESDTGNQTPAEARRALEQFEGSAQDHRQAVVCEANNERALAQKDDHEYEIQTRKLSL